MHNDRVKYVKTRIPAGTPLPDGWEVIKENPFAVAGPCPNCLGDAYGPVLQEDLASRKLTEEHSIATVIAECQCNFSHGEEGAMNCGRWWPVSIDALGSSATGEQP